MDGEEQSKTVLRRDALGRTWTTPEKRESILDEFERSGLKGAQFARLAGINYGTFATWLQKRRHERGQYQEPATARLSQKAPLRLMEAVLAHGAPGVEPEGLQVRLDCGASFQIADAHQALLAAQLLRALSAPC